MTTLEKVLKRQRGNEVKSLDDYYGIVRQLAADEFLEDDAVTNAVHVANKSMADLARDVERTRQRLEWKEKLDSLQHIEEQLAAESETLRRLDEEFEAVQRKHEEECQPHEFAIRDLRRKRLEAEQARRDLQATVVDTRVTQRQADLLSQRKRLTGMYREQHELVSRVSTRLTYALARTGESRYAEGETQQASVRLERERGKLAEMEGQIAEVDRQLGELQARMLEP